MSNTTIQTTLVTPGQSSGLVNITDSFMETFKGLIRLYIPGIPYSHIYKGLQPIESESVQLPCVMIQPVEIIPKMSSTAKYEKWYPFDFWFAAGAESVEDCIVKTTDIGEIFTKLFSNNALNDLTGAATNKFKTNGSDWMDSEMSKVMFGVPFLSGRPAGPNYCALGIFNLKLQTQKLV